MAKRKTRRAAGEGRVEELPSGRFRAVASAGTGTDGRRTRPTATFDTRAEAEGWLGGRPGGAGDPRDWTLDRWLDHWLAVLALDRSPATLRTYRKHLSAHVRPHLGPVPLRALTPFRVDRWRQQLAALPGKPAPKQRAAKTLGTALRAAVLAGAVPRSPVPPVRLARGDARRFGVWTADQCRAFLGFVAASPSARVWRLLLDSGMRPGELLALRWGDFDWERGAVRIDKAVARGPHGPVVKPPKTEQGVRTVLLHPTTVAALRPLARGPADLFWPARVAVGGKPGVETGRHSTVGTLYDECWRPLLRAAKRELGVPHIRMYDLRHTSATQLLAAGVSLRVVADRLGHGDPAVTLRHYARFLPGQQEAAREASGRFL